MPKMIRTKEGFAVEYRGKVYAHSATMDECREAWRMIARAMNEKNKSRFLVADEFGVQHPEGSANRSDCFIRCVANTTGRDYMDVMAEINRLGGMIKSGVTVNVIKRFLNLHPEFTLLPTVWSFGRSALWIGKPAVLPSMTVRRAAELTKIKGGKWIVGTKDHVFSVVDGKVLDHGGTLLNSRVDSLIQVN